MFTTGTPVKVSMNIIMCMLNCYIHFVYSNSVCTITTVVAHGLQRVSANRFLYMYILGI